MKPLLNENKEGAMCTVKIKYIIAVAPIGTLNNYNLTMK